MYKYLLCWKYLRTRYLALICIVSVMLGVATLIVVNSVMSGFSTKLRDRLHGLLSDIVVETNNYDGFAFPHEKMQRIRESKVGEQIQAMSAMVEVFAMIEIQTPDGWITRNIRLIGVDPENQAKVGGFSEYLLRQKGMEKPSFEPDFETAQRVRRLHRPTWIPTPTVGADGLPSPTGWDRPEVEERLPRGAIVGNALASFRWKDPKNPEAKAEEVYVLHPGDSISIMTASIGISSKEGGQRLRPVKLDCIVTDYFKSEMSEYDANFVFVPLDYLQELRGMNLHNESRATSIQIRLKDTRTSRQVVEELKNIFPEKLYQVQTWEDKQGTLLAAIAIEKGILNVLLFLIIAVAGFGILAIFSMIVTEKTRDIGILKALGASNLGVMRIFLSYGLLLGVVGAGLGTVLGLGITHYINEIEQVLGKVTGQEVFPRNVYYFDKIPTHVQPLSVLFVNLGSIAIAVLFSVLPALRAAMLHPVRALRYE